MIHHIVDRVTGKPYLAVDYPSARAARRARADLLRPYSQKHLWRCLLVVRAAAAPLGFPAPPELGRRAPALCFRSEEYRVREDDYRERQNARRRELAAAE